MTDDPRSRLAARLSAEITGFARGDRATKGLPRLAPEVWTAAGDAPSGLSGGLFARVLRRKQR